MSIEGIKHAAIEGIKHAAEAVASPFVQQYKNDVPRHFKAVVREPGVFSKVKNLVLGILEAIPLIGTAIAAFENCLKGRASKMSAVPQKLAEKSIVPHASQATSAAEETKALVRPNQNTVLVSANQTENGYEFSATEKAYIFDMLQLYQANKHLLDAETVRSIELPNNLFDLENLIITVDYLKRSNQLLTLGGAQQQPVAVESRIHSNAEKWAEPEAKVQAFAQANADEAEMAKALEEMRQEYLDGLAAFSQFIAEEKAAEPEKANHLPDYGSSSEEDPKVEEKAQDEAVAVAPVQQKSANKARQMANAVLAHPLRTGGVAGAISTAAYAGYLTYTGQLIPVASGYVAAVPAAVEAVTTAGANAISYGVQTLQQYAPVETIAGVVSAVAAKVPYFWAAQ